MAGAAGEGFKSPPVRLDNGLRKAGSAGKYRRNAPKT